MNLLDQIYFGNTVRQWLIALAVTAGVLVGLRIILAIVVGRLAALSKRTKTQWDDLIHTAIKKTRFLILLAAAVYAGSLYLELSDNVDGRLMKAIIVISWVQVGIWVSAAFRHWIEDYRTRKLAEDASAATVVTLVSFIGRFILWVTILLAVLDNLGFEITTLLAGLGVGGIAIALAVQNILGDLFASLTIVLDKPFSIGDSLTIGEHTGSVQSIGLKTTRLKSLSGEELVFSNNDLLQSRIRNYGRMTERRVAFTVGVTYQTPRETLEKIPTVLREAVETQEMARHDRSHLKAFGDFAIVFETVYYVLVSDYTVYMNVQQAINLRIHEQFEKEGIEFAYPTRTVHVVKSPD
jgi:small-conductance mechanosensitive channel